MVEQQHTTGVEPLRSIGDHGIIGDLETAALVARDATIDYLCWPSLDSPTIFADLLDPGSGGAFTLQPQLDSPEHLQLYVPDTNLLLTRWMADGGSAEVVDLLPLPDARAHPDGAARCIIRRLCVTRGTIRFRASCMPRFDYAREVPAVETLDDGVRFVGRDLSLKMFASVPLEADEGAAVADFILKDGESAWFVLGEDSLSCPLDAAIEADVAATTSACPCHRRD